MLVKLGPGEGVHVRRLVGRRDRKSVTGKPPGVDSGDGNVASPFPVNARHWVAAASKRVRVRLRKEKRVCVSLPRLADQKSPVIAARDVVGNKVEQCL